MRRERRSTDNKIRINREILNRFLAGESLHEITVSLRSEDQYWGQSEKHVEDILRQALRKEMRKK